MVIGTKKWYRGAFSCTEVLTSLATTWQRGGQGYVQLDILGPYLGSSSW
jgi:hypothetical protein